MGTILIVNACRYAGPDAIKALGGETHQLFCHDASFADTTARTAFENNNPDVKALSSTSPEDAVAEVLESVQVIDVLFCNHFQPPEMKPLKETDDELFRATLETLLVEPYQFIKAALPALEASEQARIILVTSAAPLRPGANVSLYTAARAGANSMVESLAKELGPSGITVFGIAPNYYASDDTYSQTVFAKSERFRASVERNVPLKRLSNAHEMPRLIRYLCLDDSAFMTGQVIAFTGGWG
ncbi:MAG: SDR family oxidoreductase [Pseudomonadota bacterium]